MKIIIDTVNRTITEKYSRKDRRAGRNEHEVSVINALVAATVGYGLKFFESEKARRAYMEKVKQSLDSVLEASLESERKKIDGRETGKETIILQQADCRIHRDYGSGCIDGMPYPCTKGNGHDKQGRRAH